ncbi:hypothetical protein DFJ74DRAFT_680391 [Hyaloraphidium curvatum]|nr:hypothetical protein DFJ74DRAFT_680391 [Hyaloraphidium curvatum]
MPRKSAEATAPEVDDEEDIYAVFGVEKTASAEDIKKAYRRLALKLHPDKIAAEATEAERAEQTAQFQRLALYYAILTDEAKRARYDATGSVSEASSSILDGLAASGKEWDAYFSELYSGIVSAEKIDEFAAQYRSSDEERADLKACYEEFEGDMDAIMESMILADIENEPRLRAIIETMLATGELKSTPAWKKTTSKAAVKKRIKEAQSEAKEAEELAKELGIHEKLGKGGSKENGEDALRALMLANSQRRMDSLIQSIEAKYAPPAKGKAGKGGKAKRGKEPEEEDWVSEEEEPAPKKTKAKAR